MKRIHFVKLLLVALLSCSSLFVWSAEETITFTNKDWAPWTNVTSGSSFESTSPARGVANNGVNGCCISISSYSNVSKIVVIASSNTTGGKVAIKIGGTQIANKSILKSNNATYTYDANDYSNISTLSGKITLSVTKPSSKTVYVKSITITYSSSGSTETTYSVTFNAGTNGTCSTKSLTEKSQNSGVTLPNCNPNTDYTFVGWATTSSATDADAGKAGEIYYPSEDCTLYAVYSAVQNYTVTWVVGSNPSKTQSYTTQVASGRKATPPAELTLTGSEIGDCVDTFVGWSKSTLKSPADNNTPPSDLFTDESPEAITANTTFYAVFAKKK